MKLHFEEVRPSDVEQELTQKDQFDTDKVPLPATLVRETLQNVMDARAPDFQGPLRVRFSLRDSAPEDAGFWKSIFTGFSDHLAASDVPLLNVDFEKPRLLVIEDFGTIGLRGATDVRDNHEFSDFWRRVGKSHKSGGKGGSWGLGKLVFPVSSRARCFFGLTIRDGDDTPKLMGQTILSTHPLAGRMYKPHGFFCDLGDDGMQIPAKDPSLVEHFRRAADLSRTNQPGLSVVIPFPRTELTIGALIPLVIEHYFFPILTGELVVELGTEVVSADTLETLAGKYPASVLKDGHMVGFIKELDNTRKSDTPIDVPSGWDGSAGFEGVFDDALIKDLRERYLKGEMLHFRLPLGCTRISGERLIGSFDVFLKPAPAGAAVTPLFIRNAITVPNEASYFTNPHVFAAMVASEPVISSFLRDAENPAHTNWNGRAEKLVQKWKAPGGVLSKIRHSVRKLDQLIGNSENIVDPDALLSFLSIPRAATERKKRLPNPLTPDLPDLPPPTPRPYRIIPKVGGFTVKGAGEAAAQEMPMSISVRMAYAISRGDPFKRYRPHDFSLNVRGDVTIDTSGASTAPAGDNVFIIDADDPDFSVTVSGFDPNRDIVVQSTRAQS